MRNSNNEIKHWTKCNYCKGVYPSVEVKGFKCIHCMKKDADKANKEAK